MEKQFCSKDKGPGAPLNNRNAVKTGCNTQENRQRLAQLRKDIEAYKETIRAITRHC